MKGTEKLGYKIWVLGRDVHFKLVHDIIQYQLEKLGKDVGWLSGSLIKLIK